MTNDMKENPEIEARQEELSAVATKLNDFLIAFMHVEGLSELELMQCLFLVQSSICRAAQEASEERGAPVDMHTRHQSIVKQLQSVVEQVRKKRARHEH